MGEVLLPGGRFGFGGVCGDVGDPAVDECQETAEAAGGQLAQRDFRPRAGQVPFAVEPRDAQGMQSPGQLATVWLAVILARQVTLHQLGHAFGRNVADAGGAVDETPS